MLVSPAPLTSQIEESVPGFEFSHGIGLTFAKEQGSVAALATGNTPAFNPKVAPTISATTRPSILAGSLLCIPGYVPSGHPATRLMGTMTAQPGTRPQRNVTSLPISF